MSTKRRVLENSFLYTLSNLLVKAIGFILLPVYTLFLTPEDYGIINLVYSFTHVASFIVAFSLYSAVIRFYTDYKKDREKLKRFYGTLIIFIFISSIIFISIGLIFNKILIAWFFNGISLYPVIVIALSSLAFICLHTFHQSILQGMQKGKKLAIINLTVFSLQVCLNLILIGFFKLGAVGVLLASLIINFIYLIYMLVDLKKNNLITLCLDVKILRLALKYSVPLMPHNLSTSIANFASRVFINKAGTLSAVGLYSIATQFGLLIDMVQSSVNKAFAPWFFDMMNEKNVNNNEIVGLSSFLLIIYSFIYVVIGLFSQEAIIFMTNEKYLMAWTAIPILVVAFSAKSIYYFYVNLLFYYKEAARKIFIATIAGSFADVILAYVLVPKFGIYGAALAFLIAKIIVVATVILLSKKYNNIGYRLIGMLKIVIPSLLFMAIGLYFSYTKYMLTFNWMNLIYKIGILVIYLIFIYLSNRRITNRVIKSGRIQQLFRRKKNNMKNEII